MPEINLGNQKHSFEQLQPGDVHTIERHGWLADDLAERYFEEAEKRAEHHQLVDALHEAEAALRAVGADLMASEKQWLDASANGAQPPERLDGTALLRERSDAVNVARLRLWRFADGTIAEQRTRRRGWEQALAERRAECEAVAVQKEREAADARALADEAAGQLTYVEAMVPLRPNRSHGVVAYDICTAPKVPPPEPMQPPRSGMEGQIVQVT
jgi:hypothetical protein